MRHSRLRWPWLVLIAAAACKGGESTAPAKPPVPTSITLSTTSHTLTFIGEALQVTASVKDQKGLAIAAQVVWSSSDQSIATVIDGLVSAVKDGTAQVTATVRALSASVTVTVAQRATTLRVTPATPKLTSLGATVTLTAIALDAGGTLVPQPPSAVWSSANIAVATVSAGGLVTAVGPGVVQVTATSGTLSGSSQVSVDDGGDLGVGWIHRSPEMDYVWSSPNATRDGWPAQAQAITWEAMVKNWSAFPRTAVPYRWTVDGVQVASGVVAIPARSYAKVDLPRSWSFTRQRLAFEIDPANVYPEVEERNNSLEVYTDALSVGFYVEQGFYDYYANNQWRLGIGSNSWEDWAQRQIRIWNHMYDDARFPLTPNGVLDRVRLDKITIVPNGALPLAGGLAGNTPNLNDRTVDYQWGFPASALPPGGYPFTVPGPGQPMNGFYFEGALIHELGHARYLIDVYGFNTADGAWTPTGIINKGSNIAIMEAGQLAAGSVYMPILAWEHVFYTTMQGLMNNEYARVDEYSAAALNLIAGRRAVQGNYNGPGNIGAFLQDLPAQNRLTILNAQGQPLSGASVSVYQSAPKPGQWYGKFFDNTPDLLLTTDAQGGVLLGSNPFSTGAIVHTYGHANGVIIVRVAHQGKVGYGFLEVWRFNMEKWRGNAAMGNYSLTVTLR